MGIALRGLGSKQGLLSMIICLERFLRAGLLWGLALSCLSCLSYAAVSAPASVRPNIVLIVADDHGTDALGSYGNRVVKTPALDALAREGVRFEHAYCTTASCSPSRSVLLTGQQSHRNGMYGLQHSFHHFQSFDTARALPVRLAEAGYRTAIIGKFHLAPGSVYRFETALSGGAANDPASIGRSPVAMADTVVPWLAASDSRPFFLYFATDDPHRSNEVLPDGRPTFATHPSPNRFGNRAEGYPGIAPVTYRPEDVVVPPYLPDTAASRAELAEYYQSVSRLDQGVARLIEHLKASGHYDNTVIVYLSDNGAAFPGAKTTLYDPGIRLPCLVRTPGAAALRGATSDAMISWTDVTPTLLDYAGVVADPGEFDGRSFRDVIEGRAQAGTHDTVFAAHNLHEITMYYPMRMIRTRTHKLIWNLVNGQPFPFALDLLESPTWISAMEGGTGRYGPRTIEAFLHRPEFELYDLTNDPDEVNNLADVPEHRELKESLLARLKAFQEQTKDPWMRQQ
jgi:N-sulfoglucosamine sulfohydrolase